MKLKLSTLLLYVCGFLLLWEWLRPVEQLTDTANLSVFIVFLFICLAFAYFNTKILIRIGVKLLYIGYTLHALYFDGSFFQLRWIGELSTDFTRNIGFVFQGGWVQLTPPFRSLLFFLLLALMSYLLHYWLMNRKRVFLFFFMTILYITVLDTFTPYDAKGSIVRIVPIGFTLMGALTFYRILDKEKLLKHTDAARKWMIPLVAMIGLSVVIGYAVPKASPIWPDPVPYIKSYSEGSGSGGSGGVKKVGYGADDSSLGGPFIGDDTIVYKVETDTRQYWKVETKDFYTGKGWLTAVETGERVTLNQNEAFSVSYFTDPEMRGKEQTGIIRPLASYPHIIYPAGLHTVQNEDGLSYEIDLNLEKIYVAGDSESGEYTIQFAPPTYSVELMMSSVDSNHQLLTADFMERYTQLPESLPQRVKDLALEITADEENWYDKAKAIEDYFDQPQYRYDQKDVAVPEEDQDYVDQFLFETMIGYCDNFSTSMVVMMRSIGIPTRWVKGYTDGSFQGLSESGKRMYEIENNNAHSWVEVFFPEVGWVPFEPTKGFSNSAQFSYDINTDSETNAVEATAPQTPTTPEPDMGETEADKKDTSNSWAKIWDSIVDYAGRHWYLFVLGAGVISLLITYSYRYRLKWLPYYLVFRYKGRKKDEDFPTAYLVLLRQLNRYGLRREEGQTLREYAADIDQYFSSGEMGALTANYEKYLYKGSLEEGTWKNSKELWENLIKKTIS